MKYTLKQYLSMPCKGIRFAFRCLRNLSARNLKHFFKISQKEGLKQAIAATRAYNWEKYNPNPIQEVDENIVKNKVSIADCITANNIHGRQVAVYGPTIDFTRSLVQRPQHIATALWEAGCFIVWITPGSRNICEEIYKNFYAIETSDYEFTYANLKGAIILFPQDGSFSSHHTCLLSIAKNNFFIYEHLDHFDEQIFGYAVRDRVFTFMFAMRHKQYFHFLATASLLQKELSEMMREKEILLNPNAVDINIFKRDNSLAVPSMIANIVAEGKPIVGYFGAVAPWLAYTEINEIMELRKDCNFIFIGPDYANGVSALNATLGNCHWIGKVDNKELPSYAQHFSIAWIPFESGEIAKATSPLKLFEYCALGLGVIANEDMLECTQYEDIKFARTVEQYSQAIDELLDICKDKSFQETMLGIAQENTWAKRATQILDFAKRHSCDNQ